MKNNRILVLFLLLAGLQCQNWSKFWLAPTITSVTPDWGGAGDVITITGSGFG
jgi:IPT/TIG domain